MGSILSANDIDMNLPALCGLSPLSVLGRAQAMHPGRPWRGEAGRGIASGRALNLGR